MMKTNKAPIYALLLLVVVVACQPMAYTASTYWTIESGANFQPNTLYGPVNFTNTGYAAQIKWDNNYILFTGLYLASYVETLGFQASQNASMSITAMPLNELDYTVTAPLTETSTTRIYLPSDVEVTDVDGVQDWSEDGNILTVTAVHDITDKPVVVKWRGVDATENTVTSMGFAVGLIGLPLLAVIIMMGRRR